MNMNMNMNKIKLYQFSIFNFQLSIVNVLIISVLFSACRNGDWEYPDNENSRTYFAYQTPVRTITLGTDNAYDNSLDNEWKCQIMATVGGFYEIKKDIEITFKVDNSLCDNLENVTAMPSNYYSLSDNSKMIIKKGGKPIGGVVVQLTEAFFADPLALKANYVIPLVITNVTNVAGIQSGTQATGVSNPNRFNPDDWEVAPKDYTLYAIKYINPYDVIYLRRGTDNITENGVSKTEKRQGAYSPENDEVIRLNSISLTELEFPVNNHRLDNINLNMTFKLNFANDGKCTFANGVWKDAQLVNEYSFVYAEEKVGDLIIRKALRVFDISVYGAGEYRKDAEKDSWSKKDRDVLSLTYQADYMIDEMEMTGIPDEDDNTIIVWGEWEVQQTHTIKYETADILVFRDRGIKEETFVPVLKP